MEEIFILHHDLEDAQSKLEAARAELTLIAGLLRMKQNALEGMDRARIEALQTNDYNKKQSDIFEALWKDASDFIKDYGLDKNFEAFRKYRHTGHI